MNDRITHDPHGDGIDRRGLLKCMAWVGTGVVWSLTGGVLTFRVLGAEAADAAQRDFTFVQISDSHIGFNKEPNKDVTGTLQDRRRQDQRPAGRPRLPAAHRRSDASVEARGVRHRRRRC